MLVTLILGTSVNCDPNVIAIDQIIAINVRFKRRLFRRWNIVDWAICLRAVWVVTGNAGTELDNKYPKDNFTKLVQLVASVSTAGLGHKRPFPFRSILPSERLLVAHTGLPPLAKSSHARAASFRKRPWNSSGVFRLFRDARHEPVSLTYPGQRVRLPFTIEGRCVSNWQEATGDRER